MNLFPRIVSSLTWIISCVVAFQLSWVYLLLIHYCCLGIVSSYYKIIALQWYIIHHLQVDLELGSSSIFYQRPYIGLLVFMLSMKFNLNLNLDHPQTSLFTSSAFAFSLFLCPLYFPVKFVHLSFQAISRHV